MFRSLVLRVRKVRSSLPSCNGEKSYGFWRVLSSSAVNGGTNIDQVRSQVTQSPGRRQGVKNEGLQGWRMRMSFPGLISQPLGDKGGEFGVVRLFSTKCNSSSHEEQGQKSASEEVSCGNGTDERTNQERKIKDEGEEPVEGDVEPPPEDSGDLVDEEPVVETAEEVDGIQCEVSRLAEDVSRLETELGDTKAKASFLAGEIEVVRHIAARDAENGKKFAVQKFAKR